MFFFVFLKDGGLLETGSLRILCGAECLVCLFPTCPESTAQEMKGGEGEAEELPIQTCVFVALFQVLTLGFPSDIQTTDPSLTSTPGCTETPPRKTTMNSMGLQTHALCMVGILYPPQGEDGPVENFFYSFGLDET